VIRVALDADEPDSEDDELGDDKINSLLEAVGDERVSTIGHDVGGADVVFVTDERSIDPQLAGRTIILGCRRGSAFEVMARSNAAGAVEDVYVDYWSWGMGDTMKPWMGVRASLARSPGWEVRIVEDPDIGIGTHPNDEDLPSLIRRYVVDVFTGRAGA
jgi:hypothetical protein